MEPPAKTGDNESPPSRKVVVLIAHIHFNSSPVWPLVADDNVPGDMPCVGMAASSSAQLTRGTNAQHFKKAQRVKPPGSGWPSVIGHLK